MNEYELMYVLHPRLNEEEIEAAIERISALVTGPGGEIITVDRWGRRRLAYPIDRNLEGFYVLDVQGAGDGVPAAGDAAQPLGGCAPTPAHSWHHSLRGAAARRVAPERERSARPPRDDDRRPRDDRPSEDGEAPASDDAPAAPAAAAPAPAAEAPAEPAAPAATSE